MVLIGGGGRTGSQLASHLLNLGHEVHLIENRPAVLAHLHQELPTEILFEGHPADPEVLRRAGIEKAQVVAATAVSDADNLALCYLAKTKYKIQRTIGCVNNPNTAWLYDARFGVDVALNRADILAKLIEEEMSMGDMMTLLKLRKGSYSIVEMKIRPGAPVVGKQIQYLTFPPNCVISVIIRKGEIVVPRGQVALEVGDEVLSLAEASVVEDLARLLGSYDK